MERKMKFSVIVPVYNCEDSLPRCIESILYQTYPDWELLLIDDGSTDGSFSLCEAYAKQDGRIRVIHQENAGQGPARNNGMKEATGDYVVFCDADDFYEKDALEIFALSAGTGTERLTDMIVGGYRDFCYAEDGEIRIRNENQAYTAKCHSIFCFDRYRASRRRKRGIFVKESMSAKRRSLVIFYQKPLRRHPVPFKIYPLHRGIGSDDDLIS